MVERMFRKNKGLIRLDNIIWNNECKINYKGYNEDINELLKKDEISDLDVIYLDPHIINIHMVVIILC